MEDELLALEAIYGEAFSFDPDADSHRIVISDRCLLVFWADREVYPFAMPPDYTIELAKDVHWKTRDSSQSLHQELLSLFVPGEVCLFNWIEHLSANLDNHTEENTFAVEAASPKTVGKKQLAPRNIQIFSGEVLLDRKSRFQAHIARASSLEDVEWVLQEVKSFPKSANATHQMVAYRFASGDSNRDDDGEGGAGDRMLHLLERMNQTDIVAVVTRWFGGIHLGPDRFKDITGVLKKLIEATPEFSK
ncbi:hypothetical protein HDU79_004014 [Rhizoclosmatium sp. JEL0117]|nr:hypothetical protein HDU79_004014 [Rhizoclosmatium sp. JEL0117]